MHLTSNTTLDHNLKMEAKSQVFLNNLLLAGKYRMPLSIPGIEQIAERCIVVVISVLCFLL